MQEYFAARFLFQLTPSRRATVDVAAVIIDVSISTHALTEGDFPIDVSCSIIMISTHALTEGDFLL